MNITNYSQEFQRRKLLMRDIHARAGLQSLSKRCLDIAVSLVLIAALSPVLLTVAFLVRATSPGPAIFRQKRYGLGARPFECYKFRTMYIAGNSAEFVQCKRNDARVTHIGRILRSTSMDELPQLFNVLLGNMSLVGPRPHPLKLDDEFSSKIPGYEMRFMVKPGITGLAQIKGHRGPTDSLKDMQRRIAADHTYVRNQSLILDLAILLATIPSVIKGKNAF